MLPIRFAHLDRLRPVLVLTRDVVRPAMSSVTVAPIRTHSRGLRTEVAVGKANGLEHDGVVSCDNILTIPADHLDRVIGFLLPSQESALAAAIQAAFGLRLE